MSSLIPPTASLFRSTGELGWPRVYNACIFDFQPFFQGGQLTPFAPMCGRACSQPQYLVRRHSCCSRIVVESYSNRARIAIVIGPLLPRAETRLLPLHLAAHPSLPAVVRLLKPPVKNNSSLGGGGSGVVSGASIACSACTGETSKTLHAPVAIAEHLECRKFAPRPRTLAPRKSAIRHCGHPPMT